MTAFLGSVKRRRGAPSAGDGAEAAVVPETGSVATRRPIVHRRALEVALFIEVPVIVVAWLALGVARGGWWFYDFRVFRAAGHAVLHGHTPSVAPTVALLSQNDRFVYPSPFAFLFAPFTLVGQSVSTLIFLAISIAFVLFAVWLLGVRDYRCYGIALLGAPVVVSLAIGTIGPLLLVLVAAGWRYRSRVRAGVFLAIAASAKLFLWPLLVWLVATRRIRASVAAFATLLALGVLWALVDPQGLHRYPTTVRVLNEVERWKSYSPEALVISLGGSALLGELLTGVIMLVGIALIFILARQPDGDRRSFAAAVALAILATPILWLHYLILLVVPLALVRPRFSLLWLVPLVLWVTPRTDSLGNSWRMLLVLGATILVGAAASLRPRETTEVEGEELAATLHEQARLASLLKVPQ